MLTLGFDTSNYTTSVAAFDGVGGKNCSRLLDVKPGELGLRQSDALFAHIKRLPELVDALCASVNIGNVTAIGVSTRPRAVEGSYMPCFLAGESAASYAAEISGVPKYKTSHQAGHVMAALYSSCVNNNTDMRELLGEEFIAFHVSGGTTDLLLVKPDEKELFEIDGIGGTRDINGGQAIDRAGVMMGLSFPCGAEMDKAALGFNGKVTRTKLSVDGTECNLSGLENKSAEIYKKSGDIAETSAYVLDFITRTPKSWRKR